MIDNICIMGLGYIGLPTDTLFASRKKQVLGVDISTFVVDAVTHPEPADAFLIAVPTPLTADRKQDLSHIKSAASAIAPLKARLIRTAREVNDTKSDWVINKVEQVISELHKQGLAVDDLHIVCFCLTFKLDINDLRESPGLRITQALAKRYKGKVGVVEPNLQALPQTLSDAQVSLMDLDEAITKANIFVVLVDHTQFKCISRKLFPYQSIIDTRGIWSDTI